jgi:uncharacterized protein with NRDE domain
MCVSAIAIGMSEQWPLVIAGNRDEFLHRPTLALHEWLTPGGVSVWGGRDEQDGGGWMLMAADGSACALVTNVRDAQLQRGSCSRGQLTLDWVDAVANNRADSFWRTADWAAYGGFNLLCGMPSKNRWWYFSNRNGVTPREIGAGLYGLSNAQLNSVWPKTEKLKTTLAKALMHTSDESLAQTCWPRLADAEFAADQDLPDTGIGLASEKMLSPVFIDWPERSYGTRSSHVISLSAGGQVSFQERVYTTQTHSMRQHQFESRSFVT